MGGIDQSIGPGLGGFLAFFLLAMALWLLMRSMNKHLRNVTYLAERAEKQEAGARPDAEAGRPGAQPAAEPRDADAEAPDEVQTRPRSLAAGYPADDPRQRRSPESQE